MDDLTIRCGLELTYEATTPTPIVLLIQPRLEKGQRIEREQLSFSPDVFVDTYADVHDNIVRRCELPTGRLTICHDAFVSVPSLPENHGASDVPLPVGEMSPALLRYTLPSRYCDSDRLMDFAFQQFGQVPQGLQRVQAICDWVHRNIEYRWGFRQPAHLSQRNARARLRHLPRFRTPRPRALPLLQYSRALRHRPSARCGVLGSGYPNGLPRLFPSLCRPTME
jgi:hypothetical protein